ncbi:MAG: hypothetical protein IPH18_15920 [Chitinophagaceae bacterium]|nr:hypothetical protein [Chitinophagaceae bacterium]
MVCFDLKGIIPDIYGTSFNYSLVPISNPSSRMYARDIAPNDPSGVSASLTVDDKYSGVINIGFPVSFLVQYTIRLLPAQMGLVLIYQKLVHLHTGPYRQVQQVTFHPPATTGQ